MHLIVGLIVLACVIVLIGVAFRISAALTRMSVRMANGLLGGREIEEFDFRRGGGYNHDPIPRPKSLSGQRIPVPGVMYAILINIAAGFASFAAQTGVLLGGAALLSIDPEMLTEAAPASALAGLGVMLGSLAAGVLATIIVLKMALPTTFLRAVVVLLCQYAIAFFIGLVLVVGLVAVNGGIDGGLPTAKPTNQPVWFK